MGQAPVTYVRLTKADRAALRRAVDDAARHWHSSALNYDVMSRGDSYMLPAVTAGRKYRALKARLAALEKAVAKLGI